MSDEQLVTRAQLLAKLGCSSETLRRYIKTKRLPPPDQAITRRKMAWRPSSLRAAGVAI